MKNLLLSSCIVLFLAACSFGHYGRLQTSKEKPIVPLPIFGENFNSFLFKTNITVYGKEYSGLLVTKQLEPNDYRVIFTTELGMKLFDFEFKDTSFTLHYCVPQFNRAQLLKVIQKDIETLLMNNLTNKNNRDFFDKKHLFRIHRVDFNNRQNYYYTELSSNHVTKIEHAKKRTKKITFTLDNYVDDFPNAIFIKHHDIKLKIELNLLKR